MMIWEDSTFIMVNKKQIRWLNGFTKLHNLKNGTQALQKLIDCYKAWGEIYEAKKKSL